jgi:ADP-ribose pyrophosphatase YjhB (NUDIX family)
MNKLLTLCLITNAEQILLGKAKRGKGMGKWNGFGGKVEAGENIEDAARREVLEEASITVSDINKVGVIDFVLPGEEQIWQVHIFSSTSFTGEPTESEEMEPKWFAISDIPYASMWPDDQYWFPLFLAGKKFTGRFVFNEAEEIVEQQLHEAETL